MKSHIFTVVLFLCFVGYAQAQELTIGEAINKAGRQRMLTQKMTKCYMMIGSKVRSETARKELDGAVALFEEQFLQLEEYAPNASVQEKLVDVRELWLDFRVKVIAEPDKIYAASLINEGTALLSKCNDVVLALEEYGEIKAARLVNISGRQRMLSQRIAMLYLAYAWEVQKSDLYTELQGAKGQFEEALVELMASNLNTPSISSNLKKVASQWDFSKITFDIKNSKLMPSLIVVTTNSILKKMDYITGLYTSVMNSQKVASAR